VVALDKVVRATVDVENFLQTQRSRWIESCGAARRQVARAKRRSE
jgi:hypothetical protein